MTNVEPKAPRWKNCSFEGCFAADVPEETTVGFEDDGTMIVLSLPVDPPTNLLAGVFEPKSGEPVSKMVLQQEITRFMIECALCNGFCVEPSVDIDDPNVISYQAAGATSDGQWWIARVYGRSNAKQFLLVDWTGPQHQAQDPLLPILVSIKLLID